MTDPEIPKTNEAPHSPGTPSLDDLKTEEPDVPPAEEDTVEDGDATEPPD